MTPLVELSRQAYPAHRDPGTAVWLTRLVRGLSWVQIYIGDVQFAAGSQLTLADCELAPAPNIFKRPRLPNATRSLPTRERLGAFLLR